MKIDYRCKDCGATGVKLWRLYSVFFEHQELRCAACAGKHQNEDVSSLSAEGTMPWIIDGRSRGDNDSIGWLCPAIPTIENDAYWGYNSVPMDRVKWWKSLPNKNP